MKPQQKLNGILKGTRQPQKQEKGLQRFSPKLETKEIGDRFRLVFTLVTIAIVTGLIAFNILGWPLLDKLAK